ncbi:MAG: zinc ribbon domain-containing protein, partial [Oscillospiraceae bacterium]|nr:zinc ribbon domain-containing protein [Oscillospiraceae bacterium]
MRNVAVAISLFMLMIIVVMLPLLIGVYVYRDAKRRGMNAALWTLIAILAPSLIGFIIYLLVRGNYSNLKCPRCDATVTEQYVVCPKCGAKLKPSCPTCSTPVEPDWTVCPRCAQPLPEMQNDIVMPVRPKDKTLWKILAAIVIIPVVLILVLGLSFSAVSGGGSSSMRETTFDEYYADQEIPESTKEYVREWLEGLELRSDHVYALRYTHHIDPESKTKDYYYLIYVPGGGDVDRRGFGHSTDLFSSTFKLELEGSKNHDGLYCAMTTSKKAAPQLRVTLDGKRL